MPTHSWHSDFLRNTFTSDWEGRKLRVRAAHTTRAFVLLGEVACPLGGGVLLQDKAEDGGFSENGQFLLSQGPHVPRIKRQRETTLRHP